MATMIIRNDLPRTNGPEDGPSSASQERDPCASTDAIAVTEPETGLTADPHLLALSVGLAEWRRPDDADAYDGP